MVDSNRSFQHPTDGPERTTRSFEMIDGRFGWISTALACNFWISIQGSTGKSLTFHQQVVSWIRRGGGGGGGGGGDGWGEGQSTGWIFECDDSNRFRLMMNEINRVDWVGKGRLALMGRRRRRRRAPFRPRRRPRRLSASDGNAGSKSKLNPTPRREEFNRDPIERRAALFRIEGSPEAEGSPRLFGAPRKIRGIQRIPFKSNQSMLRATANRPMPN